MSGTPSYEELAAENAELKRVVAEPSDRICELERRLSADSSNSSRPPSSDAPWDKKPAKKRSSRTKSGRKPGKQPGAPSASRSLEDDPDHTVVIQPDRCGRCDASLGEADEHSRQRRQVVDVRPPPPPEIIEYQRVSKVCPCCGALTTPDWDEDAVPVEHADTVAAPGSPVRIGRETVARAALSTCAHYLPLGRAREVLETLTAIEVSTGFLAGIRGRAARRLEEKFLGHMKKLLASAPVLHADETVGRAAGALAYVHVACTEYPTLMHVGDRSAATIDAGGVLGESTLTQIRSHYHGALARGDDDNQAQHTTLADKARTLISRFSRFRRFEDMILRFATDLSVAFTNNAAERAVRPVKVQQRTSGGCWRTVQGLTDFAIVQSYLDTATKWGLDKLDALRKLFTTGAWLPPTLTPAE